MARKIRLAGSPRVYGIVDQFFFSISNLIMSVLIAHDTSPRQFGNFASAYTLFLIIQVINRGAVGNVCSVISARLDGRGLNEMRQQALGASILIGCASSALLLGLSAVTSGSRDYLYIFALATPLLAAQDTARYIAFSSRRPKDAVALDAWWVFLQVALEALLFAVDSATGQLHALAWLAGGVGSLILAVSIGYRPSGAAGARRWYSTQRRRVTSQVSEAVALAAIAQGAPLMVGIVSGSVALGGMRISQTVFGPVTSLSVALALATTPVSSAIWTARRDKQFLRPLTVNNILLCVLTGVVAFTLFVMPARVGRAVLGANWASAHHLALTTSAWLIAGYLGSAWAIALRVCGFPGAVARIRLLSIPPTLGLTGALAQVHGAQGATIGLTLATLATSGALAATLRTKLNLVSGKHIVHQGKHRTRPTARS